MTSMARNQMLPAVCAVVFWFTIAPDQLGAQETRGSVCGFVVDLFGNAISESTVATVPPAASSKTDQSGRFCLNNLAPGESHLLATSLGFIPQRKQVIIQDGVESIVDFSLTAGGLSDLPPKMISGVVMGEENVPLAGARITAASCLLTTHSQSTTSDLIGRFLITISDPGQYCVHAWALGHISVVHVVLAPANTSPWKADVRFSLKRLPRESQGERR